MTRHHRAPRRRAAPPFVMVSGVVLAIVTLVAVVTRDEPKSAGTPTAAPSSSPSHRIAATAPSVRASRAAPSAAPATPLSVAEPWLAPVAPGTVGHLRPGSDPSVLPSSLLIADKLNDRLIIVDPQGRIRWQFPRPGDLAPGQTFLIPDDAFFSADGRYIIATQEDQAVITLIDVAQHRIVYRYGVPGDPGMQANHLSNPDDAMLLPNGDIITADIKNCRLLLIQRGQHQPAQVIGQTTTACLHDPPNRWGSPNGMFPMTNGHYLVTEINGDWLNEIGLNGTVYWSMHPPGVSYPSDTNEISPNRYLTADYSQAGQVVIFDKAGNTIWRFQGVGPDALNHPSLALPLPNGDVILNDDYNHRVIVVDPRTNRIVWQYGVTGSAGSAPGYLNNPDGIDLVPPHALMSTHASTIGLPGA